MIAHDGRPAVENMCEVNAAQTDAEAQVFVTESRKGHGIAS